MHPYPSTPFALVRLRLVAALLDSTFISLFSNAFTFWMPNWIAILFQVCIHTAYLLILFSGRHQATWGYRLLSMKLVNCQGGKVSKWRIFWRFLLLPLLPLLFIGPWIGASTLLFVSTSSLWTTIAASIVGIVLTLVLFLIALPLPFTAEKTSLLDKLAGTRVHCDYAALYAVPEGYMAASRWRRFFAYVIDLSLLVGLSVLVTQFAALWLPTFFVTWLLCNQLLFPIAGLHGTLGMRIVSLRWVSAYTGTTPSISRYVHHFAYFLPLFLASLGVLILTCLMIDLDYIFSFKLSTDEVVFTIPILIIGTLFGIAVLLRPLLYVLPLLVNRGRRSLPEQLSGLQMVRR